VRGTRRGCARANRRRVGRGRHQTRGRGWDGDGMEPRSRCARARVRRDPDRDGQTSHPHAAPPASSARPTCRASTPHASPSDRPRGRDRDPRTHATSLYTPPSPSPHTVPVSPHCLAPYSASLSLAAAATHSRRPCSRVALLAMASRVAVLLVAVAAVLFAAASAQEMDLGVPPAPAPDTGAAAGAAASVLAVACSAVFFILVAGGLVQ
jgi:hypothetical protein